jgi:hypothetical protein
MIEGRAELVKDLTHELQIENWLSDLPRYAAGEAFVETALVAGARDRSVKIFDETGQWLQLDIGIPEESRATVEDLFEQVSWEVLDSIDPEE